ncbi:MAG: heparinase II/III family protein [Verrucomicrobiota bacterium]
MRNLLTAPLPRQELEEILRRHPRCSPLPELGSKRWELAFANPQMERLRDQLIARARSQASQPLPELTDALYADFHLTGNRLAFERVYFERRRQLAASVVALLATGEESFRQSFVEKFEDIFREESWALPACTRHPSGKEPDRLDLFCAETANLMGECLSVFGGVLPQRLQDEVKARLRHQVFELYRDRHETDSETHWWCTVTNNWNAVCHQGILGAALALEEDHRLVAELLLIAAGYLPNFLRGFGEDGACSEGPTYWEYGFGWFCMLNEHLELRTGGELSFIAGDGRIPKIVAYGLAVGLRGGNVVNFSDCNPHVILRASTFQYLANRLECGACRVQAHENFALTAKNFDLIDTERADMLFWLRSFLDCPREALAESPTDKPDAVFENLQVWIVRGRDGRGHYWEVAAKGGHNDEHHNHNDVGSFILNLDGVTFLSEIGAPEYNRRYFSDERYSVLAARTLGHSLPLINGAEQREGEQYAASVLEATTDANGVVYMIDLTKAYPAQAKCRSFTRRLCLQKAAGVLTVEDAFTLREPGFVESAFVTNRADVRVESPSVAVIREGAFVLELRLAGNAAWSSAEHLNYAGRRRSSFIKRLVLRSDGQAASLGYLLSVCLRDC